MRSWLKLLACWEAETTVPKEKWGLRLYQSFPEGSQPRKISDQIPMNELLSAAGYDKVLTALMMKYRPFLEVAGPASVDRYFYSGDCHKGDSFAAFIAAKEVARQDLENHLGEKLSDEVAGRVLLRQAHMSELQRELVSLKDNSALMTFDEVATMLRQLDRPELLAQAAGAELGTAGAKHYPVMLSEDRENFESEYLQGDLSLRTRKSMKMTARITMTMRKKKRKRSPSSTSRIVSTMRMSRSTSRRTTQPMPRPTQMSGRIFETVDVNEVSSSTTRRRRRDRDPRTEAQRDPARGDSRPDRGASKVAPLPRREGLG